MALKNRFKGIYLQNTLKTVAMLVLWNISIRMIKKKG